MVPCEDISGDSLEPVLTLLGDNQTHQSRGSASQLQLSVVDRLIEVTRRPPQQALFGDSVMHYLLSLKHETPVVHLGDAIDVSCTTELDEFLSLWPDEQVWALAPGNHDGYLLGNVSPEATCSKRGQLSSEYGWALLCAERAFYPSHPNCSPQQGLTHDPSPSDRTGREPGEGLMGYGRPLDRTEFLRRYVARFAGVDSLVGEWDSGPGSYRHTMVWSLDESKPWRSYVVQRIRVESPSGISVALFILDTSQFAKRPTFVRKPAGRSGQIGHEQFDVVMRWIHEPASRADFQLLVGHHNWRSLKKRTRGELRQVLADLGSDAYISGHSHKGWVEEIGNTAGQREVNVGSIADAPVHFRTISVGRRSDGAPLIVINPTVVEATWGGTREEGCNLSEWCCPSAWKLPDDHRASPERDQRGVLGGHFWSAHKEANGQLQMLVHLLEILAREGAIDSTDAKIEYFGRLCPSGVEAAKYLLGVDEIKAELEALSMFKNDRGCRATTRNKSSLIRSVLHFVAERSDSDLLRHYATCQALDGAWRDAERRKGKRRVLRRADYKAGFCASPAK